MNSINPYLLMAILIFSGKIRFGCANDCYNYVYPVFGENNRFVDCYNYAYRELTISEIADKSKWYDYERSINVITAHPYLYAQHIMSEVDYDGILIGSDYCEERALNLAEPEIARYYAEIIRRLASSSSAGDRGLRQIIKKYKTPCKRELEKHNLYLNSKDESFQHAFKILKKSNIPDTDTFAKGYFEDILSKTEIKEGAQNIEDWCANPTNIF